MSKEMIISSNGHETMVAILEDDLVAEIFVERERHRGVVGNVYKGRVSKVLPGMQSSFIDLGLERDGFLYVADVMDTLAEFDKLAGDEDDETGGANGNGGGGGGGGRRERRRQDRPQPAERRHPRRPRRLPQNLDRDAPAQRVVARAGRAVPGAKHRRAAAPRSPDRGLPGDSHRQRAGVPARAGADRAHHAEPGAEGEALLQAVPDLRRVRRAGRDRQGA